MNATNDRRRAWRAGTWLAAGVLSAMAAVGCGKKGPPLAPYRPTPARILEITPRRLGDTVHVAVAIPVANLDGTQPVDLERVDVYAFTGMKTTDIRDVIKHATKVGSIPVQRVFTDAQLETWQKKGIEPPPNPGLAPGTKGTATETLTPDMFVPVTPRDGLKRRTPKPDLEEVDDQLAKPLWGPVEEEKPLRYYAAVGISRKNVKGPNSIRPGLSLEPPASPPRDPVVAFTDAAITLQWTAPVEQRDPIQVLVVPKTPAAAPAATPVATPPAAAADPIAAAAVTGAGAPSLDELEPLPGTPKGVAESIQYEYNVYLVPPKAEGDAPPARHPGEPEPGTVPLNDKPLAIRAFEEPIPALGAERCYAVRAVYKGVESEPSVPVCVTPIDNFPPPPPSQLAAIASEGAVSLIWEGVTAADLAGYVVMRADGPLAPLAPLFEEPLRETSYRDTTAKPGVRYVYAVVAVDTATPRNVSLPSNRVEEIAR